MTPEQISRRYNAWIVVRRWAGTWVDTLLVAAVLGGLLAACGTVRCGAALAMWSLFLVVYYVVLEGCTGRTFGKLVCRIVVVGPDGRAPGLRRGAIRTLVRLVDVNPLLAGGIPAGIAALVTESRQRLGDLAAGTYVLRAEDLPLLAAGPGPEGSSESWLPPGDLPPGARWAAWPALVSTLVSIALIVGGALAYRHADATEHPTTISCAQFLLSRPKDGWYRITGCQYNIADAVYYVSTFGAQSGAAAEGPIGELYLPLFASDPDDQTEASLVVLVKDERLRQIVRELDPIDENDEKGLRAWAEKYRSEVRSRKDIVGMVSGKEAGDATLPDEFAKSGGKRLAGDYRVIRQGEQPTHWGPIGAIVGGVFVAGLALIIWIIALVSAQTSDTRPVPARPYAP